MASEQARRENTTTEREVQVEKDIVPKMTVHYESLAHYTTEKAVEGTKAAAGAVQVATEKAAELSAKPFTAAKQAVVSTGVNMIEYTARKKEEAEREVEAKKTAGKQGTGDCKEESQVHATAGEAKTTEEDQQQQYTGSGSSVLGAIGETIVEIARAIGQGQPTTEESGVKIL